MVFYQSLGGRSGATRNFCALEVRNPLKSQA